VARHGAGGQAQQRAERVGADEARVGEGVAEGVVDAVVDGVAVASAQPRGDVAGQRRQVPAVFTELILKSDPRVLELT